MKTWTSSGRKALGKALCLRGGKISCGCGWKVWGIVEVWREGGRVVSLYSPPSPKKSLVVEILRTFWRLELKALRASERRSIQESNRRQEDFDACFGAYFSLSLASTCLINWPRPRLYTSTDASITFNTRRRSYRACWVLAQATRGYLQVPNTSLKGL